MSKGEETVEQLKSYAPVAWAILIGILLQGILTIADCKESPNRTAVEFVKAYFQVDPAMAERLCEKLTSGDDANLVEKYVQKVSKDAVDRGFDSSYMKHIVYHIETRTHVIDADNAEVRLTARSRRSINLVFALIGKFFLVGETHEINEIIPVVKENGKWKVCRKLFALSEI